MQHLAKSSSIASRIKGIKRNLNRRNFSSRFDLWWFNKMYIRNKSLYVICTKWLLMTDWCTSIWFQFNENYVPDIVIKMQHFSKDNLIARRLVRSTDKLYMHHEVGDTPSGRTITQKVLDRLVATPEKLSGWFYSNLKMRKNWPVELR